MAPPDLRRPYKRAAISDQQRRRELALQAQATRRADAQARARRLASSLLAPVPSDDDPLAVDSPEPEPQPEATGFEEPEELVVEEEEEEPRELGVAQATKLKGSDARRWFASQLMMPEWMIDAPPHLDHDWYVFARPSGKRCFVISSNGATVSRLRNGSILHRFPSALPGGARAKGNSAPAHSYSILDCIFHEGNATYYVIDMVCWKGYSLYDCTVEFRFFWLNSKLTETGACDPPSAYHRYQFSLIPVYDCTLTGLQAAYSGSLPYVKDGLLFYNKHAHYQSGNTPLALVWKDENSSQYLIDTDGKGQVPSHQQVVLELQADGKLASSDDPPFVFGCLDTNFISKSGLRLGNLIRFTINDESVKLVDGKLLIGELHYSGKANRARAFADSYSKVLFQYAARHAPLRIADLAGSIQNAAADDASKDVEMAD